MNEERPQTEQAVSAPAPGWAGRLLAAYVRFVFRSSRKCTDPRRLAEAFAAHEPFILAGWHGGFLLAPILLPEPAKVSAIVARHGDAELMGSLLSAFGVRLVRGAGAGGKRKDKGGAAALRAALRELNAGRIVAMTADVPPGPAREPGIGIITMARLSGRPIVPVVAATSRFFVLDTWSRFIVNLPFARLAVLTGEPLSVPGDADAAEMERLRCELRHRLDAIGADAYRLVGADDKALMRIGAGGPPPPGFVLRLYRGLMRLAEPLAPRLLGRRLARGKEDAARLPERMGRPSLPRPAGFLIWVHAASVGETNAVLPLIHRLRQEHPDRHLLLTTGTVTSARIALERLPAGALYQSIPVDVPRFVGSFLDHWRPDLALFVESELWPSLVLESADRGVPLVLLNGRMSHSSYKWWRRTGLARPLMSRYALVMAQNEGLRVRFHRLGARRVEVVANLKFDAPPLPVDAAQLELLRQAIDARPLLLAASTHPGEEETIIVAHALARQRLPQLLTIIVPRHPHRGAAVQELAQKAGLSTVLRSAGAMPGPDCEVYIADTLGELGLFYSLAGIAFIGGSLIEHGGQNPIEAVALGASVLSGRHVMNFTDAYQALWRSGGGRAVEDAGQLAAAFVDLVATPGAAAAAAAKARDALAPMTGGLQRSCDLLQPFLADRKEDIDAT